MVVSDTFYPFCESYVKHAGIRLLRHAKAANVFSQKYATGTTSRNCRRSPILSPGTIIQFCHNTCPFKCARSPLSEPEFEETETVLAITCHRLCLTIEIVPNKIIFTYPFIFTRGTWGCLFEHGVN